MTQHEEEQDLLEKIRNSNYAAFEELHHRYYKPLYTLAYKKIGDQDEAYDLLQDMFTELWEKRADFRMNNPLPNYLKNRLWFKLSVYFRTKGFHEKHLRNFSDFLQQEESQSVLLDPIEIVELGLQYDALLEVIDRTIADMPDKMLEVFVLSRSSKYTRFFCFDDRTSLSSHCTSIF